MTTHPRADIPVLADDPVKNHPTRGEQLDILASLAADLLKPGDSLIDLGVGVGYVARMIAARVPGLELTGIDLKPASLAGARACLAPLVGKLSLVEGDLNALDSLAVPGGKFRCAVSVLTFHDLPDDAKRRAIAWIARHLQPGGVFLFLDRVRLDEAALFPLQVSLWNRMIRVYGESMRRADTYEEYLADLTATNRVARFKDYLSWFAAEGLAADCIHRHGNIALFGAAKT